MKTLLDYLTRGSAIEVFNQTEKLEVLNACDNIGLCWADRRKASSSIPQGDRMYFVVREGKLRWGSISGNMRDFYQLHDWKTIRHSKASSPYLFSY